MEPKAKITAARVLHSQLDSIGAPRAVTQPIVAWIAELERDYKSGILSDDVSVSDEANVELIDVRGPKQ